MPTALWTKQKPFSCICPPDTEPARFWLITVAIPEGLAERSEGNRIWKALASEDGPVILELVLEKEGAWVHVHAERKLGRRAMAFLHEAALRMLGLNNEVTAFQTRHRAFAARRKGLRLPNLPTGFDGLAWGIIGQQINMKFASALRRELIALAGEKVGNMHTHPTPERVADLSVSQLHQRRYSRSKASYLIDAAATIARGELDIESLHLVAGGSEDRADRPNAAIRLSG